MAAARQARKPKPRSRSGYEERIQADLEERGIAYEYEPVAFKITVPVPRIKCQDCGAAITRVTRYTPDFRLGGRDHYLEAKGKLTAHERRRLEAFFEQHVKGKPGWRFRILFMRDNWMTPKKKARYSDWARKLGIECAVGEAVPEAWVQFRRTEG